MHNIVRSLIALSSLLVLTHCGSAGGTTAAGGSTRGLTGTVSLGGLSTNPSNSAGLNSNLARNSQTKAAVTSCSGVSLCCWGYDTDVAPAVAALDSACTFDLNLPLGGYCFCGFFNGSDADGDLCPDDYLSEDLPPIPVFASASGSSTTDINAGTCADGTCDGDIAAQVDEDGDGTANDADTDDDGDSIADGSDTCHEDGCGNPLALDSDADDIPDFYEELFDALTDTDSDGIPDEYDFDVDGDGSDNDADSTPDSGETLSIVACVTVQDCREVFQDNYPEFGTTYSESSMSCSAGTCLYDCHEHATTFAVDESSCTAHFTDVGQTCSDAGSCQMYPKE